MPTLPPAPSDTRVRHPLLRWAGPLALLAVAAFAFVIVSVLRHKAPREHELGALRLECLRPSGVVSDYGAFEARGAKPPGGWFRIAIHAADAAPGSPPLLERTRVEETRWLPTPAELQTLPNRIVWHIQALGPDGVELDRSSTSAQRQR